MSQELRTSICDEDIERIVTAAASAFQAQTGMTREDHLEQHRFLLEEMKRRKRWSDWWEKFSTHVVGSIAIMGILTLYKYVIHPLVVPLGHTIIDLLRRS